MSKVSVKKATMINGIAKYSNAITNIIFTAVLARILSPKDFGVIAIVGVFISFFSTLSDMGLGTSIIQNKELNRKDISSIFGFSMYIAFSLALIFCILSIPISIFYHDKVYIGICAILSITIIFDSLNMVPSAILMREKKFVVIGIRMIVVNITTGIFTIFLAIMGAKYYALVFQSVISSAITFIWNYSSTKPELLIRYDKNVIKKIKSYSGFHFAFSVINYFARNTDNLLIGKFMGGSELAYYDKGYKLMLYPVGYLTNVITPILHPILSDYQNDKKYIYEQYMKVVRILSILGVFISLFCFFFSKEIIVIMFGDQWENSIQCFRILSLSVWAQMICSSTGSIFLSIGNSKLMFISGTISAVETIIMIAIGLCFGSLPVLCVFITIAYNVSFFINYFFLLRYGFKSGLWNFFGSFIPDIIVGCIILITMSSIHINLSNQYILFFIKVFICIGAYIVGLFITKRYKVFTNLLKRRK
ncbi:lipopolysaccharide biosynthesis protein [Clostridium diolis]|uniref:lipopolysaccharide biosynthesis protein n=1 Tax=Clostridium diolis TaxID=223919 RepID=UPI0015C598C0|nr:lipopolysaccharide biosynthesis protein [Clostridium diolis]